MCHTNKNKIGLTTKEHDSSRLMVSTSQISGLVTTPVKKAQSIKGCNHYRHGVEQEPHDIYINSQAILKLLYFVLCIYHHNLIHLVAMQ